MVEAVENKSMFDPAHSKNSSKIVATSSMLCLLDFVLQYTLSLSQEVVVL